jgi:hypothetical protein
MTNGHVPYIMPDGRSLAAVLKAEGPTHGSLSSKRKNSTRPKDELWGQLQLNKVSETVTSSRLVAMQRRMARCCSCLPAQGVPELRVWCGQQLYGMGATPAPASRGTNCLTCFGSLHW